MIIGLASCTNQDTPWDFGDFGGSSGGNYGGNNGGNGGGGTIDSLPFEDLSAIETEALLYMIEEEKLAHDVYVTLYGEWNLTVFNSISQSEQTHYNALLDLLNKYNIDNPVEGMGAGEFSNAALQRLYTSLVATGTQSETDALNVGATIEDLDISDIIRYLDDIDNQDITLVLNNLQKGSENHLRAFYGYLQNYGVTYTPQYISQELFEEIIDGTNGRGRGRGR